MHAYYFRVRVQSTLDHFLFTYYRTTKLFVSIAEHFITIAYSTTVSLLMTCGFIHLSGVTESRRIIIWDGVDSTDLAHVMAVLFLFEYTFSWLLFCHIGNLIDEMVRLVSKYFA